jgi:hypothetical protein
MNVYVHTRSCTWTYIHMHIHIHIHLHTHIHIHTHKYTYIHAHTKDIRPGTYAQRFDFMKACVLYKYVRDPALAFMYVCVHIRALDLVLAPKMRLQFHCNSSSSRFQRSSCCSVVCVRAHKQHVHAIDVHAIHRSHARALHATRFCKYYFPQFRITIPNLHPELAAGLFLGQSG